MQSETGRSVSLVCLLASLGLLAACLINPRGVYPPWELTFGICLLFVLASAACLVWFHLRMTSAGPDPDADS